MKKMLRVALAVLAAVLFSLAIAPAVSKAAILETDYWGTCKWEIDDTGTLTVHPGKGASTEDSNYSPWNAYSDKITSVVFKQENGQKVVGDACCRNLFGCLYSVTNFNLPGFRARHGQCAVHEPHVQRLQPSGLA